MDCGSSWTESTAAVLSDLQLISSNVQNKIKDPHLILCLAAVPSHFTLLGYKRKMGNSSREDKSLPQSPLLHPLCHQQPSLPATLLWNWVLQAAACPAGWQREWWWLWQEHWKDWNSSALAGETEVASSVWHQPARLEVVNSIFTETFLWLRASFFKPLEIFLEQSHKCSLCVCTDLLAQGVVAFPQYFSPVTEVYAQLEPAVFHSCAAFTFHS